MKHEDKPQQSTRRNEALIRTRLADLLASTYVDSIKPLNAKVQGKVIRTSQGGSTGYILYFGDDTYLLAYLSNSQLCWKVGSGQPSPSDTSLIHSVHYPDLSAPQNVKVPYANEENNIAAEVAKAHGQMVKGIAYGEDTFNLVFPDGHEIDATLLPSADRKGLRVFWEQW